MDEAGKTIFHNDHGYIEFERHTFQDNIILCDAKCGSGVRLRTIGIYGGFGGILHVLIPSLAVPVFILFRMAIGMALAIAASGLLLHYRIDRLKERILKNRNWDFTRYGCWQTLGADQMLHNFTYVGVVAALAAD